MRRIFRQFRPALFIAVLVGSALFVVPTVVEAQSAPKLTAEQKNRIIANCVSIKSSLNQLHASDALLRVNRGQVYESLASRLMDRFNDRLGGNGLDNRATLTVTGNYRTQLNTFRSDYINYEQHLSAALDIDCTTKPVEFYEAVETARSLRRTVHSNVTKLHNYIDDYRSAVDDFLLNYERLSR